jgi:hypothetical protein
VQPGAAFACRLFSVAILNDTFLAFATTAAVAPTELAKTVIVDFGYA